MTWFEDLSPCYYFGEEPAEILRSVGWLSPEHKFHTGSTSREFFQRLVLLASRPPRIFVFRGSHCCEFCSFTGSSRSQEFDGLPVKGVSHLNLFVPGNGFLFAAPESLPHYIDAHQYCPPHEFIEAVLDLPEPDSMAYKKRFLEAGGRELMRMAGEEPRDTDRT